MSTLVQIQLGPIIRWSTRKWYNPLCFPEMPDTKDSRIKRVQFSDRSLPLFSYFVCSIYLFCLLHLFVPINSDLANNDLDSYQDHEIESIKSNEKNKVTQKKTLFFFSLGHWKTNYQLIWQWRKGSVPLSLKCISMCISISHSRLGSNTSIFI